MTSDDIISGVLVDEIALTVDELAHACGVSFEWISVRVELGVLRACPEHAHATAAARAAADWRFSSRDLWRARKLRALERDFDAPPELAALVVDLQEELASLRAQLRRLR